MSAGRTAWWKRGVEEVEHARGQLGSEAIPRAEVRTLYREHPTLALDHATQHQCGRPGHAHHVVARRVLLGRSHHLGAHQGQVYRRHVESLVVKLRSERVTERVEGGLARQVRG